MNAVTRYIGAVLLVAGLTGSATVSPAAAHDPPHAQTVPKPIYDESADANADIADALAKAKRDNTRVLVMYGANWCGWCHKLHGLFESDREIRKILLYEYRLVMVDIGRWDKHMEIAQRYGADLKTHGVPFLTVLDADGKVLANQETGPLEAKPNHDPEKVKAFLSQHIAPPRDAREVLAAGLARAKAEQKLVFLHFGAPWCGWCHRLEEFLAREEIAAILTRDYVDVKIDVDRMTNGKQVAGEFRGGEGGGIPWFAILNAESKVLATADGPKGNVGFPVEPFEIAHFTEILQKNAKRITAEQIATIERTLQESAAKIKASRRKAAP